MRTVEIQIEDELFDKIGEEAIVKYLEAQIRFYKLEPYLEQLSQAINDSGIDLGETLNEAKKKAWQEHQRRNYPYLS